MTNQDEMAKKASPEQAAPVVAVPEAHLWPLMIGEAARAKAAASGCDSEDCMHDAVQAMLAHMRLTPTPSAETIDTDEFRELLVAYGGSLNCPEDAWLGTRRALIAHLDARMAAARQEARQYQRKVDEKIISRLRATHPAPAAGLTAQQAQAIEMAAQGFWGKGDPLPNDSQSPLLELVADLYASSAQATAVLEVGQGRLTDVQIDKIMEASEPGCMGLRYRFARAIEQAILAQQPAQAVAVPEGFVLAPSKQTPEMLLATISCRNDEQCLCRWRPVADDGTIQCEGCAEQCAEEYEANIAAAPLATQAPAVPDVKKMVDRFLGWPIPKSFSPDCGISFKPIDHPSMWPTGTNLLTADEARQMFEHVLAEQEPRQKIFKSRAEIAQIARETGWNFGDTPAAVPAAQAVAVPTNDEVYAAVCADRGKLNHYVSTNAVNDVMAAVRRLMPAATHEGKAGDGGRADDWKLVMDEVERATRKFPTWPTDPLHAVAVLGEEFGELTKAVLQTTYEPHKVQDGELRTEAIQTAAMSLRFLASLGRYEFTRSVQHEQQAQQAGKAGA